MLFTKRLRDRVRGGEITCSVRVWQSPRVPAGARYRMEAGVIGIDSIESIGLPASRPSPCANQASRRC